MPSRPRTSNVERLFRYLRKVKVATARELEKFVAARVTLRRLVDGGKLLSLGAGLYASPSLDPFVASVIATARYYPKAVISNLTALSIHELSDERIDRIDVDIERNSSLRNSLLRVHRVPAKRLIGISSLEFHGENIAVYDIERSLCEAYRLDKEGPLFFKALKRYLKRRKPDTAAVLRYDNTLKTRVLHHIQQELADA